MFKTSFKITTLLLATTLIVPSALAVENTVLPKSDVQASTISNATSVAALDLHGSASCAMDLMPVAKTIYQAVSPKVEGDSNLRKLVKKEVKPKVFSGKLSIKMARENAQAASVCLHLLKTESISEQ